MVFVTGDTHRSDLGRFDGFCKQYPFLTKADYMIIAGDFGGVWSKKTLECDLDAFFRSAIHCFMAGRKS